MLLNSRWLSVCRILLLPDHIWVSFNNVIGNPHTAYVAIVEISINTAIINQLAWIRIPAISVFLMISIGFRALFPLSDPIELRIDFKIANKTINHNAKLAKFLVIFQNDHKGASI